IDSKILKIPEKKLLLSYLPKKDRKKKWKLLFRASKYNFNSSSFHQKCDNAGAPTVTIVLSTLGNVFGGYTTLPWTSDGSYKSDLSSFIFLLKAQKNATTKKGKWPISNTSYSVHHGSGQGPTFGIKIYNITFYFI